MFNQKHTIETKERMRLSKLGVLNPRFGKIGTCFGRKKTTEQIFKIKQARAKQIITDEHKKKISESMKLAYIEGRKISFSLKGGKSPCWIDDRSQLKKSNDRRGDYASVEWVKNVKSRDGGKCKIYNSDCAGRLEVHHILRWIDYPELRYDLNNGITLCHFHHPRKKIDEVKLSPYFKTLVGTQT